ncbi:hypothetical protein OS493_037484 [Desmophyllum pertusum]|uniref:Uncharacterized protein n=1 Tax=Desmophyllum pertusum TaxID=174260 RepID=A0A9X0CU08_9CNID|nr:hypothetical protein OS493_037484 [Desmophyllum pertusum]
MVAISDCSQYTGLYKVDNLNCELFYEIGNPWWTCGLMHFSPDGQDIFYGYLKDDQIHYFTCEVATNIEGTGERVFTRTFLQEDINVSCWPWEFKSLDKGRFLFLCLDDYQMVRSLPSTVYRFSRLPSFSLIRKESLLVGSPFSKEVFMINLGEVKERDDEFRMGDDDLSSDVAFSVDGKYRYRWFDYIDQHFDDETEEYCDNSDVNVTVYNEERMCHSRHLSYPSLLLPVREGVLLLAGNGKLELRDFELSRCVRTFSEVDAVTRLFPVSEDLVGCLAELDDDCWKGNVTSIACNSQFQFVACSGEHTSYDDNDNDRTNVIIVTVAVWNKRQHLWKRSIITERGGYNANASALITRDDDLVVTWQTVDEGAGIHILNATTGATLHKLLTDQRIIGCTFLSDGKHFVCCSGDETVRLFNVNSGVLISLIDIEISPYRLAACLNQPLFAVNCENNKIKIFRVHVPEVKDSERKDKRIKLQSY